MIAKSDIAPCLLELAIGARDGVKSSPILPTELTLMILERCTGITILRWRRVNKFFKRLIDTSPTLERAIFGRFPLKVMLRILEYTTRPRIENNPLICEEPPDKYQTLIPFEQVSTVYNASLHNHPWIRSYMYRGGKVYGKINDWYPRWQAIYRDRRGDRRGQLWQRGDRRGQQ